MQTRVMRVVYPRPEPPSSGWLVFITAVTRLPAVEQLQQTSTSLEFVLRAVKER